MGISVFPAVFLKTFDMDVFFFFLVFIEFVTILLLFSVLFFLAQRACGNPSSPVRD